MLDHRAADAGVGVDHVDVAGADPVGVLDHRAHEGRVLSHSRLHQQLLALGEVDPGADEQPGVGAQARLDVVGHETSWDALRIAPDYGRRAIRLA